MNLYERNSVRVRTDHGAQQRVPLVERRYLPESAACENAIRSLLKSNVRKAIEPAPEPDGRDDQRLVNEQRRPA